MSPFVYKELSAWLSAAVKAALPTSSIPSHSWSICPKPELADLTNSTALQLAKQMRVSPVPLAQKIVQCLTPHPYVDKVAVNGPGHLNISLSDAGWAALLQNPLGVFEAPSAPPPTLVEFVSANPTGPLHLGHARQAILGDVLSKLLKQLGGTVGTEFFYNDAGAQIDRLEESLLLRVKEHQGAVLRFERDGATSSDLAQGEILFPKDGYHGAYVADLAAQWLSMSTSGPSTSIDNDVVSFDAADAAPKTTSSPSLRQMAISAIQDEQHQDLSHMGVVFDQCVSESSLHQSGAVTQALSALLPHSYEALQSIQDASQGPPKDDAEPALFLTTTKWGDDKDRVMKKSDGSVTYFVPDVAYHLNKWDRGWVKAINIQGSDHHGTLSRVQAGIQAARPEIGPGYPKVIFHTMIKVVSGGEPVKASKRAGDYVTARDVVDAMGMDAFRLAMLDKKPDTHMTLDIQAWLKHDTSNPVYNIQYAHARLCVALQRVSETPPGLQEAPQWHETEKALLLNLMLFTDHLHALAEECHPTGLGHLVRSVASRVHDAYQQGPKLLALTHESRVPRVELYQHALSALRHGCLLLGVSCPEKMPETNANPVQRRGSGP